MFPSMIARAVNLDVISGGMGGTRNGAIQVVRFFSVYMFASLCLSWLELIKIMHCFSDAC